MQGYFVESYTQINKIVNLYLERESNPVCLKCGKEHLGAIKDKREQNIKDLSIFGKQVILIITKERFRCNCGYSGFEKIEWLDKYSRTTKRLNKWLYKFCKVMSVIDVSRMFGIHKDKLFKIDKEYIKEEMGTQPVVKTKAISMDEISKEKGKVYATIVSDPNNKKVLDVLESRKKVAISSFFKDKGKSWCKKIGIATMDAWLAFKTATQENCQNAKICYDHFHLAQHFSRAIDKIRISEIKRIGKNKSEYLKGSRWLLLKNPINLKETEKESLNNLLKENKRLFKVYLLRSEFRQIFQGNSPQYKVRKLNHWIKKCRAARVKGLSDFVDKIVRWKPYIENALIENVSNSYAEGINVKIRVIQRKAYGYKDFEYFRIKVFQQFNFPNVTSIWD